MMWGRQRMPLRRPGLRQRGVAVITALLLTTLAVTIVASLFWQQQVQVRSMENQRLQLQTRWILRGALDWSKLILYQDAQDASRFTSLTGVWATPLAETRLDDYVERQRVEGDNFDATLSGQITDAQARYNLANLVNGGAIVGAQRDMFKRLLTLLRLDPALAQAVADQVRNSQPRQPVPPQDGAPAGAPSSPTPPTPTPPTQTQTQTQTQGSGEAMAMMRVEDLLAVSGFTPPAIERLRDLVIVLPARTALNVNTAPAELLSALFENFSLSEATALVNKRKQLGYYRDVQYFNIDPSLNGRKVPDGVEYGVKSDYFLVNSRVKLDRAALDTQALLQRPGMGPGVKVLWIREN